MMEPPELGRTISPNMTKGEVDAYTSLRHKLINEVLQRLPDTDSDNYYFTLP
jgi:hypothetical protein